MNKPRVFISFDYDHDVDLKNAFVAQAKNPDTPFDITDMSIKETVFGDWKAKARSRIKGVDQMVVICGQYTNNASGVDAELKMAQEEGKAYFLLKGRPDKDCVAPKSAKYTDKIYPWTWPNLKALIAGSR